ncbi:MAG: hypothetical protein JJT88_03075 [Gammaproteobacteria bacterium]|nr:hypothetical protein [Gammaproteobacteria bacterium]
MQTTLKALVAMLTIMILAAPAFGSGCPGKMAEIDQRLAAGPMLDAEVLEEIVSLRTEGEAMHQRGQHSAAMAALEEALAVLEEAEGHDHH